MDCSPHSCPILRDMGEGDPHEHQRCLVTRSWSSLVTWFCANETAQSMAGALVVVLAACWLVRALLQLALATIGPILVLLVAAAWVPTLRDQVYGDRYNVVAQVLRAGLLRLADALR